MTALQPQIQWCLCCLVLLGALAVMPPAVEAAEEPPPPANGSDLAGEIEAKNQEIKRLEAEAEKFRATLGEIGRTADTLQSQVAAFDRAIKGLDANIRLTNAKISRTNLEIRELATGIREKETSIGRGRERLAVLVRQLAASERETAIGILVKHETLAAFFASLDALLGVQRDLQSLLAELRSARQDLTEQKGTAEAKRLDLASLSEDLADQKALQVEHRRERSQLLTETRHQERRYQELLTEVERKREALQREINALESDLQAADPALLPAPGAGLLGWPLPEPVFITQRFGQTAFARAGAYNGSGHNGIDLRAAAGTPVFASEQGAVRAIGDTDLGCRRASYGRWVLVDHPQNLATLYAHLSLVKIKAGDGVNRGELIGYSGRTGYATGPHLHFSVFARAAVSIGPLTSRICGRTMTLPLSHPSGYLDPLGYL